eukprot:CAMPEP_0198306210 /NCGR_PEP_ID=MMETSP1449-20131203/58302_1 /TAXON_ID=420275 /ORGANISM="Attheya septentrionalis, Strain CCMP2084" /LENGTH=933 /DNA_ID=CAMNT_0044008759 /DNA_START=191 /DNA_END=2992 /DNA_ORIENTATION=+
MKLRTRDMVAALLAIGLVRWVWTESYGSESLDITLKLSFYSNVESSSSSSSSSSGHNHTVAVAPPMALDVDGDGIAEALVVPATTKINNAVQWRLKVLDLKPLHRRRKHYSGASLYPFFPSTLFLSSDQQQLVDRPDKQEGKSEEEKDPKQVDASSIRAVPIKMISTQLMLKPKMHHGGGVSSSVTHSHHATTLSEKVDGAGESDQERHYFCGNSWHDAAEFCHKHCPSGSSTDCPEEMTCYADTPCDSLKPVASVGKSIPAELMEQLTLTPIGSLPSVVTLWSDGTLTLHGVTVPHKLQPPNDTLLDATTKSHDKHHPQQHGSTQYHHHQHQSIHKSKHGISPLGLVEIWRSQPFHTAHKNLGQDLAFQEVDIMALDAFEASIGEKGVIIVSGSYTIGGDADKANEYDDDEDDGPTVHSNYHAINAVTGSVLWSTSHKDEEPEIDFISSLMSQPRKEEKPVASARRRSHVPLNVLAETENASMEDCLHLFRSSVLDPETGALPHMYWGPNRGDAKLTVAHFDRGRRRQHPKNKSLFPKENNLIKAGPMGRSSSTGTQSWQSKVVDKVKPGNKNKHPISGATKLGEKGAGMTRPNDRSHAIHGKPNVVLAHNSDGIQALSIRNGKPVCHLSLMDHGLYADINGDGIIDHVQVVTDVLGAATADGKEKWVKNLVSSVVDSKEAASEELEGLAQLLDAATGSGHNSRLCHALVLSGLPAREELFSASLCNHKNSGRSVGKHRMGDRLTSAPPLLVEGLDSVHTTLSSRPSDDYSIVFALSNGVVSRYDAHGRQEWTTSGLEGIPSWRSENGDESSLGFLGRIHLWNAPSAIQPILLSGEDGMAIFSAGKGHLLASTKFPQPATQLPILADVNGDGTTDVVIVSADALWGYEIVVSTAGSNIMRMLVGLVFLGIAIAALQNKFGNPPGVDKRSTDA